MYTFILLTIMQAPSAESISPASVQTAASAVDSEVGKTYCNPLNIDYGYCPIPNFFEQGKHRTTADPVIVRFRDDYYLFSTNQSGYWWSEDLLRWSFVPRKFLKPEHKVYDELCAPAVFVMNDSLYVIGSTHEKTFALWRSRNPRVDDWSIAVDNFQAGAWDPAFLVDDDQRVYLYYGSSNSYPLYGMEIDKDTLTPKTERQELIQLHDDLHGWERFGEANDNTFLKPFIEGAWMTKHNGRYYLQYGAPGTEFSGYADGVYISDKPLGPFRYQDHNPFSFKPGGFVRGAGHGATFQDKSRQWWHTSTITIAVKNNFERRIGLWPTKFDADGILSCDTAFGDYPHYLQYRKSSENRATASPSLFTGWMLLNFAKPVQVSSTLGACSSNFAVDEDLRTYWSAQTTGADEWIQSDLGRVSTIHAIQVNYADHHADLIGKVAGLKHQYRLLASSDATQWHVIADKSDNQLDVPHDYVAVPSPVKARFVRLENVHVPTGKFAISGLRVFGHADVPLPETPKRFVVLRGESERRNAWLKWQSVDNATGYIIRSGVSPEKLYTSVMIYSATEYYFRAMDRDRKYYFSIEAFNEAGVSKPSDIQAVD